MEAGQQRVEELRAAMSELKRGALYNIVAAILAIVGLIVMLVGAAIIVERLGGSVPVGSAAEEAEEKLLEEVFATSLPMILGGGAVLIASLIVYILGWLNYMRGSSLLVAINPDYGIGSTGTKLYLAGLGLVLLSVIVILGGAAAKSLAAILGGAGLLVLGGILALIGAILFAVMLIRMDDVEKGFKTAGIIMLVGVILSVISVDGLPIVGQILVLVAHFMIMSNAGKVLTRLEQQTGAQQPSSTPSA